LLPSKRGIGILGLAIFFIGIIQFWEKIESKKGKQDYLEEEGEGEKEKLVCCSCLLYLDCASITFIVQNFVFVGQHYVL
jgi:hypothetical protein